MTLGSLFSTNKYRYMYIHVCIWNLQVGFTKDGKITAVECDIYNNAGHSLDLSAAVSTIHFLLLQ